MGKHRRIPTKAPRHRAGVASVSSTALALVEPQAPQYRRHVTAEVPVLEGALPWWLERTREVAR